MCHIQTILQNMKDSKGLYQINEISFNFSFHDKTICPHAFAILHDICYNTLRR